MIASATLTTGNNWSGICCRVLAAGEFVRVHGLLSATDMCRSGLLERCPINDSNQRSATL